MATINIETLGQAQEYLLQEMSEAEKIWGQLQSDGFRKGFKGQNSEYQDWRVRASDAYNYKKNLVNELIAYIEKKWGIRYKNSQELRVAINERSLSAPEWLSNGHEESVKLDPMETETVAQRHPEVILSVQSEAMLDAILKRLVIARNESGLTMTDAARYFGYTGQAVSNWERGETPVTLLNIFKLARIYEVDPLWILTGEKEITREHLAEVANNLEISMTALWDLMGKE